MIAPEVNLINEDDREMYFAHRPIAGIVIMLIGMGVVYFFAFHIKEQVRWMFVAAGSLFALAGFAGALWRYELRLDLVSRNYSGRKGFWPKPKPLRGSLDELEGVVLSSRVDRDDKRTTTVWMVGLRFRHWDKPVTIKESANEPAAYQALEHYAKKLRVPVIDRTGAEERDASWVDLDKPLAEQPDHPVSIPPLPHGSAIEFTPGPGRRSILLPADGFSLGAIMLVLFGLPFFSLGGFFLWSLLFDRARVHGSIAAGLIVSPLFMLVGLYIVLFGIAGVRGRQLIEEEGGDIVFSLMLFNLRVRPRRVLKKEVEEVSIKPVPGRNNEKQLVIRSDKLIMRIGDQKLSPKELEWLKVAVSVIASGPPQSAR
jgi:hypothetical protein